MKKLLFVLILALSLSVSAFAVDDTTGEGVSVDETTEIIDQGTNVYVDNDVILSQGQNYITGVNSFVGGSLRATDTYGLKAALLNLLGEYDTIIVEYEYQNTASDVTTHVREVQPDYVWIASACILALFVFCLFKMGVAVWKR